MIAVIAISIGIGIKFGLQRSSLEVPSSTSPVLKHGALNDTSFAAASASNGDRHVFFQDINGTLRHATYIDSFSTWLESVDYIPTVRQPRNRTPLSAIEVMQSPDPDYFNLYYIDTNDTLAAIEYAPNGYPLTTPPHMLNDTFSASTSARSLSVSRLYSTGAPSYNFNASYNNTVILDELLLFYQSYNDNVTVLRGTNFVFMSSSISTSTNSTWVWQNVTELFFAQTAGDCWVSSPFSVSNVVGWGLGAYGSFYRPQSNLSNQNFFSCSFTMRELDLWSIPIIFKLKVHTANSSTPMPLISPDLGFTGPLQIPSTLAEEQSDLLAFRTENFLVYNKTLYSTAGNGLDKAFPFGRLAAIFTNGSTYVYHQLNENVLLEEIDDTSHALADLWVKTTSIIIPTD